MKNVVASLNQKCDCFTTRNFMSKSHVTKIDDNLFLMAIDMRETCAPAHAVFIDSVRALIREQALQIVRLRESLITLCDHVEGTSEGKLLACDCDPKPPSYFSVLAQQGRAVLDSTKGYA
jgi:hypothetical protein